jgi:hypothetical protein
MSPWISAGSKICFAVCLIGLKYLSASKHFTKGKNLNFFQKQVKNNSLPNITQFLSANKTYGFTKMKVNIGRMRLNL